jgi:hypothetical protein
MKENSHTDRLLGRRLTIEQAVLTGKHFLCQASRSHSRLYWT